MDTLATLREASLPENTPQPVILLVILRHLFIKKNFIYHKETQVLQLSFQKCFCQYIC